MNGISRKQHGFTIVELLIVIVVIGILAAITIVAYNGIQKRAGDTERKTDISAMEKSLQMYFVDHQYYPTHSQVKDTSWVLENMAGVSGDILVNPSAANGVLNSYESGGSATQVHQYNYYAVHAEANPQTLCTVVGECTGYVIGWRSDATGEYIGYRRG